MIRDMTGFRSTGAIAPKWAPPGSIYRYFSQSQTLHACHEPTHTCKLMFVSVVELLILRNNFPQTDFDCEPGGLTDYTSTQCSQFNSWLRVRWSIKSAPCGPLPSWWTH